MNCKQFKFNSINLILHIIFTHFIYFATRQTNILVYVRYYIFLFYHAFVWSSGSPRVYRRESRRFVCRHNLTNTTFLLTTEKWNVKQNINLVVHMNNTRTSHVTLSDHKYLHVFHKINWMRELFLNMRDWVTFGQGARN